MNIKKIISLMTTICFLVSFTGQSLAWAAPDQTGSRKIGSAEFRKIFENIPKIPAQYGKVTNVSSTGSKNIVINIQDLHCHPEAQKNINKIIEILDKNYKVSNIYVEGAYDKVDTQWLSGIQDKSVRNAFAAQMIEDGNLNASEYYAVVNDKKDFLLGLEDKEKHEENIKRLGYILDRQEKYAEVLSRIQENMDYWDAKYTNIRNKRFNKTLEKYELDEISTERFYVILCRYMNKINKNPQMYNNVLPIKLSNYPNIQNFLYITRTNAELDMKKVQTQLQSLLAYLKAKLPPEAFQMFLDETDNLSDINRLASSLSNFSAMFDINLGVNYGQLNTFFNLQEMSGNINPLDLIAEERHLTERIRIALSYDQTEVEISFLNDFSGYFKSYLQNKLMADDFAYFDSKFDKFKELYSKYALINDLQDIESDFGILNAYYKLNDKRNDIFTENIFNHWHAGNAKSENMKSNNPDDIFKNAEDIAIVVTGGYHSHGLKEILTKKGITNIIITPTVTSDVEEAEFTYEEMVKRQSEFLREALAFTIASQASELQFQAFVEAAIAFLQNNKYTPANVDALVGELKKVIHNSDIRITESADKNETTIRFRDGKTVVIGANEKGFISLKNKPVYGEAKDAARLKKNIIASADKVISFAPTMGGISTLMPDIRSMLTNYIEIAEKRNLILENFGFDFKVSEYLEKNKGLIQIYGINLSTLGKLPSQMQIAFLNAHIAENKGARQQQINKEKGSFRKLAAAVLLALGLFTASPALSQDIQNQTILQVQATEIVKNLQGSELYVAAEINTRNIAGATEFSNRAETQELIQEAYNQLEKGGIRFAERYPVLLLKGFTKEHQQTSAQAFAPLKFMTASQEAFEAEGTRQKKIEFLMLKIAHEATHIDNFYHNTVNTLGDEYLAYENTVKAMKLISSYQKEDIEIQQQVADAFRVIINNPEIIVNRAKTLNDNAESYYLNYSGIFPASEYNLNNEDKISDDVIAIQLYNMQDTDNRFSYYVKVNTKTGKIDDIKVVNNKTKETVAPDSKTEENSPSPDSRTSAILDENKPKLADMISKNMGSAKIAWTIAKMEFFASLNPFRFIAGHTSKGGKTGAVIVSILTYIPLAATGAVLAFNPVSALLAAGILMTSAILGIALNLSSHTIIDKRFIDDEKDSQAKKKASETKKFYHGGLDESFNFDELEVDRLAEKQQKRGREYAGFYLFDEADKGYADEYAQRAGTERGVGVFEISADARILDLTNVEETSEAVKELSRRLNKDISGLNIERITREQIQTLRDMGYDMISGPNVFTRTEYVLLNKDVVQNYNFERLQSEDTKELTGEESFETVANSASTDYLTKIINSKTASPILKFYAFNRLSDLNYDLSAVGETLAKEAEALLRDYIKDNRNMLDDNNRYRDAEISAIGAATIIFLRSKYPHIIQFDYNGLAKETSKFRWGKRTWAQKGEFGVEFGPDFIYGKDAFIIFLLLVAHEFTHKVQFAFEPNFESDRMNDAISEMLADSVSLLLSAELGLDLTQFKENLEYEDGYEIVTDPYKRDIFERSFDNAYHGARTFLLLLMRNNNKDLSLSQILKLTESIMAVMKESAEYFVNMDETIKSNFIGKQEHYFGGAATYFRKILTLWSGEAVELPKFEFRDRDYGKMPENEVFAKAVADYNKNQNNLTSSQKEDPAEYELFKKTRSHKGAAIQHSQQYYDTLYQALNSTYADKQRKDLQHLLSGNASTKEIKEKITFLINNKRKLFRNDDGVPAGEYGLENEDFFSELHKMQLNFNNEAIAALVLFLINERGESAETLSPLLPKTEDIDYYMILGNKGNTQYLRNTASDKSIDLKKRLFALLILKTKKNETGLETISDELRQAYIEAEDSDSFNVSQANSFELKAALMGMRLALIPVSRIAADAEKVMADAQDTSLFEELLRAEYIKEGSESMHRADARADMLFTVNSKADTIAHELMHIYLFAIRPELNRFYPANAELHELAAYSAYAALGKILPKVHSKFESSFLPVGTELNFIFALLDILSRSDISSSSFIIHDVIASYAATQHNAISSKDEMYTKLLDAFVYVFETKGISKESIISRLSMPGSFVNRYLNGYTPKTLRDAEKKVYAQNDEELSKRERRVAIAELIFTVPMAFNSVLRDIFIWFHGPLQGKVTFDKRREGMLSIRNAMITGWKTGSSKATSNFVIVKLIQRFAFGITGAINGNIKAHIKYNLANPDARLSIINDSINNFDPISLLRIRADLINSIDEIEDTLQRKEEHRSALLRVEEKIADETDDPLTNENIPLEEREYFNIIKNRENPGFLYDKVNNADDIKLRLYALMYLRILGDLAYNAGEIIEQFTDDMQNSRFEVNNSFDARALLTGLNSVQDKKKDMDLDGFDEIALFEKISMAARVSDIAGNELVADELSLTDSNEHITPENDTNPALHNAKRSIEEERSLDGINPSIIEKAKNATFKLFMTSNSPLPLASLSIVEFDIDGKKYKYMLASSHSIKHADKDYVEFTAGSDEYNINRMTTKIAFNSPTLDIALLEVPDFLNHIEPLKMSIVPAKPGDRVFSLGYPFDEEFMSAGYVQNENAYKGILSTMKPRDGTCGSAILNMDGEVIGIRRAWGKNEALKKEFRIDDSVNTHAALFPYEAPIEMIRDFLRSSAGQERSRSVSLEGQEAFDLSFAEDIVDSTYFYTTDGTTWKQQKTERSKEDTDTNELSVYSNLGAVSRFFKDPAYKKGRMEFLIRNAITGAERTVIINTEGNKVISVAKEKKALTGFEIPLGATDVDISFASILQDQKILDAIPVESTETDEESEAYDMAAEKVNEMLTPLISGKTKNLLLSFNLSNVNATSDEAKIRSLKASSIVFDILVDALLNEIEKENYEMTEAEKERARLTMLELLYNALIHGNNADMTKNIQLYIGENLNDYFVINADTGETTSLAALALAAKAGLHDSGQGSRRPYYRFAQTSANGSDIFIAGSFISPQSDTKREETLKKINPQGKWQEGKKLARTLNASRIPELKQGEQIEVSAEIRGQKVNFFIENVNGNMRVRGLDLSRADRSLFEILSESGINYITSPNMRLTFGQISKSPAQQTSLKINDPLAKDLNKTFMADDVLEIDFSKDFNIETIQLEDIERMVRTALFEKINKDGLGDTLISFSFTNMPIPSSDEELDRYMQAAKDLIQVLTNFITFGLKETDSYVKEDPNSPGNAMKADSFEDGTYELLKNAFSHGNHFDLSKNIYLYVGKEAGEIYFINAVSDNNIAENVFVAATNKGLFGGGIGTSRNKYSFLRAAQGNSNVFISNMMFDYPEYSKKNLLADSLGQKWKAQDKLERTLPVFEIPALEAGDEITVTSVRDRDKKEEYRVSFKVININGKLSFAGDKTVTDNFYISQRDGKHYLHSPIFDTAFSDKQASSDEPIETINAQKLIEQNYSHIGEIKEIKALTASVFLITTADNKKYALKAIGKTYKNQKRTPDYIAAAFEHMQKNNIKHSKLLAADNGSKFIDSENSFYMLNEFVDNASSIPLDNYSARNYSSVIDFIVSLQKAMESFGSKWLKEASENARDGEDQMFDLSEEEMAKTFDTPTLKLMSAELKKAKDTFSAIEKSSLKKAYIHGDLHMENVLFDESGDVAGIIDFEQLAYNYRIYEFLKIFIYRPYLKNLDKNKIADVIAQYQKQNQGNELSPDEISAFIELLRFQIVRYSMRVSDPERKAAYFQAASKFASEFSSKKQINDFIADINNKAKETMYTLDNIDSDEEIIVTATKQDRSGKVSFRIINENGKYSIQNETVPEELLRGINITNENGKYFLQTSLRSPVLKKNKRIPGSHTTDIKEVPASTAQALRSRESLTSALEERLLPDTVINLDFTSVLPDGSQNSIDRYISQVFSGDNIFQESVLISVTPNINDINNETFRNSNTFVMNIFRAVAAQITQKTGDASFSEDAIFELLKNAYAHGNNVDASKPVYIYFDGINDFMMINEITDIEPSLELRAQMRSKEMYGGGTATKRAELLSGYAFSRTDLSSAGSKAKIFAASFVKNPAGHSYRNTYLQMIKDNALWQKQEELALSEKVFALPQIKEGENVYFYEDKPGRTAEPVLVLTREKGLYKLMNISGGKVSFSSGVFDIKTDKGIDYLITDATIKEGKQPSSLSTASEEKIFKSDASSTVNKLTGIDASKEDMTEKQPRPRSGEAPDQKTLDQIGEKVKPSQTKVLDLGKVFTDFKRPDYKDIDVQKQTEVLGSDFVATPEIQSYIESLFHTGPKNDRRRISLDNTVLSLDFSNAKIDNSNVNYRLASNILLLIAREIAVNVQAQEHLKYLGTNDFDRDIFEVLKNAFTHGNALDFSKNISILINNEGIFVINEENDTKPTLQQRADASWAGLYGRGAGILATSSSSGYIFSRTEFNGRKVFVALLGTDKRTTRTLENINPQAQWSDAEKIERTEYSYQVTRVPALEDGAEVKVNSDENSFTIVKRNGRVFVSDLDDFYAPGRDKRTLPLQEKLEVLEENGHLYLLSPYMYDIDFGKPYKSALIESGIAQSDADLITDLAHKGAGEKFIASVVFIANIPKRIFNLFAQLFYPSKARHILVNYHFIKQSGIVSAVKEFGNAATLSAEGYVNLPVYVVTDKIAESDLAALGLEPVGINIEGHRAYVGKSNGAVVIYVEDASHKAIANELGSNRKINDLVKQATKTQIKTNIKNISVEWIEIDHSDTQKNITYSDNGNVQVGYDLFKQMIELGEMLEFSASLRKNKNIDGYTLAQGIFHYLDLYDDIKDINQIKDISETDGISNTQYFLDYLTQHQKTGNGQMVINSIFAKKIIDEIGMQKFSTFLNAARKDGVLVYLISDSQKMPSNYKNSGFSGYLYTSDSGKSMLYNYALGTDMEIQSIDNITSPENLEADIKKSNGLVLLKNSALRNIINSQKSGMAISQIIEILSSFKILKLFTPEKMTPELALSAARNFDIRDMPAEITAGEIANIMDLYVKNDFEGIISSLSLPASHPISVYIMKLKSQTDDIEAYNEFVKGITEKILTADKLRKAHKPNGLQDKIYEIILGRALVWQALGKTFGKGVSINHMTLASTMKEAEEKLYETLQSLMDDAFINNDAMAINSIVELIPAIAEERRKNLTKDDIKPEFEMKDYESILTAA